MKGGILLWLFLKGSLLSTGGFGNLPILHDELLSRGWATEREFAESLAIGQVTPGPNGLWVLSLGYMVGGVKGSLLALLAISLPPLLVLALHRFYRRNREHPAVEGFIRGLSLGVVGVFFVVLLGLLLGAGLHPRSAAILLASLGLGSTRRVPVILLLGGAALVGIVWK